LSIEDDIIFIERVPTLRMLGREALRVIAIGAESRFVHKGEVLFVAEEAADCAFVIQEGSFRLETKSKLAADLVVGPGTLLGEMALIAETKRPATATANEPSTVIRISRNLFLKMLEGYPNAAYLLRDRIVSRAQQALSELSDVRAMLDTSPPPLPQQGPA
jgi:CRP-like cAMP-binding protein